MKKVNQTTCQDLDSNNIELWCEISYHRTVGYKNVNQNTGQDLGLSPPVKYFTDCSKAVLLLWIFCVFFFCLVLLCLCVCLFVCALGSPAGRGPASWLWFVMSNCEFVTFPLVS